MCFKWISYMYLYAYLVINTLLGNAIIVQPCAVVTVRVKSSVKLNIHEASSSVHSITKHICANWTNSTSPIYLWIPCVYFLHRRKFIKHSHIEYIRGTIKNLISVIFGLKMTVSRQRLQLAQFWFHFWRKNARFSFYAKFQPSR